MPSPPSRAPLRLRGRRPGLAPFVAAAFAALFPRARARMDLAAKRLLMGHATRDTDETHYDVVTPAFLQEEINKVTIPLAQVPGDGSPSAATGRTAPAWSAPWPAKGEAEGEKEKMAK